MPHGMSTHRHTHTRGRIFLTVAVWLCIINKKQRPQFRICVDWGGELIGRVLPGSPSQTPFRPRLSQGPNLAQPPPPVGRGRDQPVFFSQPAASEGWVPPLRGGGATEKGVLPSVICLGSPCPRHTCRPRSWPPSHCSAAHAVAPKAKNDDLGLIEQIGKKTLTLQTAKP